MKRHSHRRLILLFLAAVTLPCIVLVAAGVRMVGQERELAEARLLQERNRVARQLGQDLLVHLDQLWGRVESEVEGGFPLRDRLPVEEVAFVAEVRDGLLSLPWEAGSPGPSPGDIRFLQLGERQELGAGNLEAAVLAYQEALEGADNQAEAALARLFLARALAKGSRLEEALGHYRALLAGSTGVTDDLRIPVSYYAAERLVELAVGTEELVPFLTREARNPAWTTPSATHLLRDVATGAVQTLPAGLARDSAAVAEAAVEARVRETEQVLALANDLDALGLAGARGPGLPPDRWVRYGSDPWLIGVGRTGGGAALLVSVNAEQAIHGPSTSQGRGILGLALAPGWAPDALTLDPRLRGVSVAFTLPEAEDLEGTVRRQRAFYSVVFLLVMGFTLFGGYLLWRDVQREVGMARLRSQFVSGVSHELRTPLTSIRMFAETLLHRGPEDRETHDEFLGTIVDESNRLSRLLGNVLEFSAIERGKRQYQMQRRDLGEIVLTAVKTIQQRLESEGFNLSTSVEEDLPPVSVDGDAVEQAVLNLLTNAMKYSGDSREIGLALKRENGTAVVSVTDLGIGIPSSEQRRIFESFYRGDSPAVEEIPGTGLGLTLVDHIATAHGGSVELDSTPGEGSTFTLRLPLARSES